MSLTLIAILAAVWLALLVVVWALCVAAGRADGDQLPIATAAPEADAGAAAPAPPVVVDTGRLSRQLEATAELVGASKVALQSCTAGGAVELAAAPEHRPAGGHSVTAHVTDTDGAWVELVAHRSADQPDFTEADVELLSGVASLLARKTSFNPVERSDRFVRHSKKPSAF
jgi:hypothetical protein